MSKNLSLADGMAKAARELIYQSFERGYKNGCADRAEIIEEVRQHIAEASAKGTTGNCETCAYADKEMEEEPCVSCSHCYSNKWFPKDYVEEKTWDIEKDMVEHLKEFGYSGEDIRRVDYRENADGRLTDITIVFKVGDEDD